MNNFVNSYFEQCLAVIDSIKKFTVDIEGESLSFDLMVLSEEYIEKIEACVTHKEMLSMAANYGVSFNEERVIDSVLAHKLGGLWAKDELNNLDEPNTQDLVGAEVCRISGIASAFLDGDAETLVADLGEVEAQLNAQNNINQ